MALYEGCCRLRKAGRYLTFAGPLMLIVAVVPGFLAGLFPDSSIRFIIDGLHPALPLLFVAGWFVMAIGALLWTGSWILEGFASPGRQSD
jgi:hypothetical protein